MKMEEVFVADEPYDPRPEAGNKLCFSNFLLTINTNVSFDVSTAEHDEVCRWLLEQCNNLFDDWSMLNGTVLKPAGSDNRDFQKFDEPHLVEGVRSRICLEQGKLLNYIHAHVLLEVAHRYAGPNQYGKRGVHVNAHAMRQYLMSQVPLMSIAEKPRSIYVNCRLQTSMNDTQNKWMTLQYINKDTDKFGNNLAADKAAGTANEQSIVNGMLNPDLSFARGGDGGDIPHHEPWDRGDGGPLPEYSRPSGEAAGPADIGGDIGAFDFNDNDTQVQEEAPVVRRGPMPVLRPRRQSAFPRPPEGTSEWDDRPIAAVWTESGRNRYKRKQGRK